MELEGNKGRSLQESTGGYSIVRAVPNDRFYRDFKYVIFPVLFSRSGTSKDQKKALSAHGPLLIQLIMLLSVQWVPLGTAHNVSACAMGYL